MFVVASSRVRLSPEWDLLTLYGESVQYRCWSRRCRACWVGHKFWVGSGVASPFLRKVTTASGATAVQVVTKEGWRNKILEHVGSAHTEAELAALMKTGRDTINAAQVTLDLGLKRDPQATVAQSTRSRFRWCQSVEATWGLGLPYV